MRTTMIAAALIVATAPAAAIAQPARSQAKALVDAGLAAHDRGDYDAAIALYAKAYDLLPHPALFFNMGQSHRLAGRADQAIAMYRRYLQEVTTGALADQARAWIATLEQARPAPPGLTPPSASVTARTTTPGAPDEDGGRTFRIAGYASGAAGAIALGAGVMFGLKARRISDELSQPGAPFEPATYESGRTAERRMIICYGAGGALIAAGTVLYLLGRSADEPSVTPIVGESQVGLSWSGSF